MENTKTVDEEKEAKFSEKILSVSFTLLGILLGLYGVISTALSEAGPWYKLREATLPFLLLIMGAILLDCLLGFFAILSLAGYMRARVTLTLLSCTLLIFIIIFIATRSLQLWL